MIHNSADRKIAAVQVKDSQPTLTQVKNLQLTGECRLNGNKYPEFMA